MTNEAGELVNVDQHHFEHFEARVAQDDLTAFMLNKDPPAATYVIHMHHGPAKKKAGIFG